MHSGESMRNIRISLAVTFLMVVSGYATNASAGAIQGAGAIPCSKWVEDRASGDHNMTLAWVMGFMSSYNHYINESGKKNGVFWENNYNSIALWMDNYCRRNPLETVYSGSYMLIEEMKIR